MRDLHHQPYLPVLVGGFEFGVPGLGFMSTQNPKPQTLNPCPSSWPGGPQDPLIEPEWPFIVGGISEGSWGVSVSR